MLAVVIEMAPPLGIASLALIARLRMRVLELAGIREGAGEFGLERDTDLDFLAQRALQQLAHAVDQRVAVDLDRLKRLTAAIGEQALGELGSALAGVRDGVGEPLQIVARSATPRSGTRRCRR